MKSTTQKMLLSLYGASLENNGGLTTSFFSELLSELSTSGRRSLILLLEQKKRVSLEKIAAATHLYITEQGRRELLEVFPALQERNDQQLMWNCIVFRDAPKGDEQFRYLRSILMQAGAFVLTRGVYAYPGCFPKKILDQCYSMYANSIFLFSVSDWQLGIERSTITRNFGLADLATAYSGISNEIDELLATNNSQATLNNQQKQSLFSAYDRFRELLKDDVGLLPHFYPQVTSGIQIVKRFQHLFALV